MDPSSPTFLLRCESNPALYTRCTMLWMGQLGADSMEVLPRAVFHSLDDEQLAQQARLQLVKQMVSVHNSQALATGGLNATGATPLMYHGFLKCWRGLFSSQRAKLSERVEHFNGG